MNTGKAVTRNKIYKAIRPKKEIKMYAKKIRFLIGLLLLLALLPACSQAATEQLPTATPKPTIQLTPCTGYWHYSNVLCGTLRVLENRADPAGRKIDLKVVVVKATSKTPAPDPIFYLAGGPGGAAASEDARYQQLPYSLSENHDLVFVDQRGTGESNRVMVPTGGPDVSGLTLEQMDAVIKPWLAAYLAKIDMDPRYYTTSVFVDDLDEVRQALGYDKIDLVGFSYGSTAAQYYLRQHEAHVRSVTLGVGSLLDIPVFELEPQRAQQALDGIFDLCLADLKCSAAFPNIKAEFNELMARLVAEPKVVPYNDPATPQLTSITFTADYFAGMLRAMMKDAKNDPILPLNIHRAAVEDDWQGFINYYRGGGGPEWWGDQMMERVIRCGEKWAAFDPAKVAENSQGSFMAARSIPLSQIQALNCRYTPVGEIPEGQSPQPGSQVPLLMFNGTLDPLDPPANVEGAADLFPNSLALALPYQAHQQSNMTAILCYFSILNDFIQNGSAEGLNVSCLQNIQPPAFVTP
jgi:pimeloyl-ACP methyl ester carboxylesterase